MLDLRGLAQFTTLWFSCNPSISFSFWLCFSELLQLNWLYRGVVERTFLKISSIISPKWKFGLNVGINIILFSNRQFSIFFNNTKMSLFSWKINAFKLVENNSITLHWFWVWDSKWNLSFVFQKCVSKWGLQSGGVSNSVAPQQEGAGFKSQGGGVFQHWVSILSLFILVL